MSVACRIYQQVPGVTIENDERGTDQLGEYVDQEPHAGIEPPEDEFGSRSGTPAGWGGVGSIHRRTGARPCEDMETEMVQLGATEDRGQLPTHPLRDRALPCTVRAQEGDAVAGRAREPQNPPADFAEPAGRGAANAPRELLLELR